MNTNRSLASLFFLGLTFPPDLLLSGLNPNLREPTSSSSALLLNRITSEMEVALCYSLLPLFRLFQLHYTADTLAGMVIRLECCWMQALQASEQKRDGVYGGWTRWSGYPLDCLTTSAPVVLKRLVIFITFDLHNVRYIMTIYWDESLKHDVLTTCDLAARFMSLTFNVMV